MPMLQVLQKAIRDRKPEVLPSAFESSPCPQHTTVFS